jgi:hypothetical protein
MASSFLLKITGLLYFFDPTIVPKAKKSVYINHLMQFEKTVVHSTLTINPTEISSFKSLVPDFQLKNLTIFIQIQDCLIILLNITVLYNIILLYYIIATESISLS